MTNDAGISETSPRPSPRKVMTDAIAAIWENADLIDRLVRVVGNHTPSGVDLTKDADPKTQAIRGALMDLKDITLDLGKYPITPEQARRINN